MTGTHHIAGMQQSNWECSSRMHYKLETCKDEAICVPMVRAAVLHEPQEHINRTLALIPHAMMVGIITLPAGNGLPWVLCRLLSIVPTFFE